MPLPTLAGWDATRRGLHRASQVISTLRRALIPPQPNALHLSLYVNRFGLTSGRLPDGSELALDFASGEAVYHTPAGNTHRVRLAGRAPNAVLVDLLLLTGADRDKAREKMPEDASAPLDLDSHVAADYATVLYAVYSGLARFRARLSGTMTPLVVWPHGFDLSFLWFRGNISDEQREPHLNFGFSPGSEGLPRPYLYAYAWPTPDDLTSRSVPVPASIYTGAWKGVIASYDEIARAGDTEALVETLALEIYRALL